MLVLEAMGSTSGIQGGDSVKRKEINAVPGDSLLGRVVDAMGDQIDGFGFIDRMLRGGYKVE